MTLKRVLRLLSDSPKHGVVLRRASDYFGITTYYDAIDGKSQTKLWVDIFIFAKLQFKLVGESFAGAMELPL